MQRTSTVDRYEAQRGRMGRLSLDPLGLAVTPQRSPSPAVPDNVNTWRWPVLYSTASAAGAMNSPANAPQLARQLRRIQ